jgi:putative GTP pyrophosphokinase
MSRFSKTQIDKLGERLREGELTEEDLRMLDEYRRSFEPAYQHVVTSIRDKLQVDPTGRPAKSTSSIVDKLRRPGTRHARLSQIQDIAGCRLITLGSLQEQNAIAFKFTSMFDKVEIVDRRERPSNGYRAIHVIVLAQGVRVEVQIRTKFQQFWSELCEKLSDDFGSMVKYGGGDEPIKTSLQEVSNSIYVMEQIVSTNNDAETDQEFEDSLAVFERHSKNMNDHMAIIYDYRRKRVS